ncbi:thioesterase II family protein [Streptomyces milbemycinicus]|uniref:thioesterase II family protein n=1 Tax=Streptomyces milbemycinicus TaxID=476552 RepID=UPI0033E70F2D
MNDTSARTRLRTRTTVSNRGGRTPTVAFIPPSCCGAGYFRGLRRALGERVDFRAVELPGHGRRYREVLLTRAEPVMADVTAQLGGRVDAIYGESLGSYIGLAAAASIRQRPYPLLIAASNSPPSVRERIRTEELRSLDGAVATLTSMGGEIPAEVLRTPELAERLHPVIRDDLHLSQSFIDLTRFMTTAGDIQVLAGADDDASVRLESWADHTTGRCEATVLPGGHLLSADDPSGVAEVIVALLTSRRS